jgi:hypothetical protein
MKNIILLFLSICFYLSTVNLLAQDLKAHFDSTYNRDPLLYNGIIFNDLYKRQVKGTQFFEENTFKKNELGISDQVFSDQYINYDVYHQKLLLTYLDDNYAQKMIEIPLENVQFFTLNDHYFEVLADNENSDNIYEVYAYKNAKILIYWLKFMKENSQDYTYTHRFSNMQRQTTLYINDHFYRIKNNKEFISYLPEEQRETVKVWMKEKKIKIEKADSQRLDQLVKYLDKL